MKSRDSELPEQKFSALMKMLRDSPSAVLAYSGGVDSSFLLKAMKISGMRFLAVTGNSETVPGKDLKQAVLFAESEQVPHRVIDTCEMQNESFVTNPPDRCFHCKQELFQRISRIAAEESYDLIFDGSNADDLKDFRPGRRAAEMFGVRSPLAENGLTKEEIRQLSKKEGLKFWDRPSSPCLSSRFVYGQRITVPMLRRVEQAEDFLRSEGYGTVRVRVHDDVARIEVTESEMKRLMEERTKIVDMLKSIGFKFIALDLEGFRSGSMNRVLSKGMEVRRE